jgi:TonB-linked SusC/RagA family outer membrane protein
MKNYLFKNLLIFGIFMLYGYSHAQSVSGTVSDANGPLPGANVIVKGTGNGVTTDFDGNYTINDVPSDGILEFSFVGYVTQEIVVDGQTTINVTMIEDTNALDEVIVIGYTTQTRGDLTGAVGSVDISEAIKTPVVNAAELLEGRVAGVTVVNNGEPGSAPKVNIRGFGTSNNTNPLYIIDGVQTDDPNVLNNINPADIDQMNVLKDAAAAIYGARAANGVIIITTKSGGYNMGQAKLSVDFYTGSSQIQNIPSFMNPVQHGNMIWESLANDGAVLTHPQYGTGPSPVVPTQLLDLPPSAPTTVTVAPGGTNWVNAITRNAPTQNASISLENGSETGKYLMSASYLNRQGTLINTGYKRGSTRLNSEFKVANKRITIGEHLNTSFSTQQNPGNPAQEINTAFRSSPLIPVFDDDGNYAGPYSNGTGLSNNPNPVARLDRTSDDYSKSFQVFGDIYLAAELYDGLTFKTLASGSITALDTRTFSALDPESAEAVKTNTLVEGNINLYNWTWTNTLTYNKTFGYHSINALVGIEAIEERSKGSQISRTGFLFETPDFYLLENGSGTPNVDFAFDGSNTLFSIFGTVNYSYKGKYLATVTLRNDTSSRFKGDNKSATFPSFSAGWIMSKEDFFPQDAVLSNLKLRGSYGEIGNQTLPVANPTQNISNLSEQFGNYAFNGSSIATGAVLSQVGNPNLKWETSKSTNIGIDLGFFNNNLSFTFEYFNIVTDDLITRDLTLIPTTGPDAAAPFVNVGSVKNTGFDITLSYYNKTDSGFSYGIDANLSSYNNEVTDLISDFQTGDSFRGGPITRTQVGQPISSFYGRVVEGVFKDAAEVAASPDQGFVTDADGVGRFKYKDLNGDGVITDDDRTFIGSPHPDFTYGINLTAGYGGFDLSAFFSGSSGNDIYNYEKIFTDFPTFFNGNRSTRLLNAFNPTTNPNSNLPALSQTISNSETNPNTFFVEDGSFFRLKNLQIGYTLPSHITDKASMSSVRFYFQGTNLFTISGYDGLDPEIISNRGNLTLGIDFQTYPISRILSLGVNIKL